MNEIDRPSNSQDSARDQQIAEDRRRRPTEKTATQYGSQQRAQGHEKKLQSSAFDEVLKNVAEQGSKTFLPESKFDSRLKETQGDQERSSSSHRESDEESRDVKKRDETAQQTKENSAQNVKERVLGKHSSGGQGQESSGGSGEQRGSGSGQGFSQKHGSPRSMETGLRKEDLAPAPTPASPKIDLQTAAQIEAAHAPRELPKAVLDQIVQYVRIGVNKELNKEIQIDFHDHFFNGIKLKVVSHGKEVSVEFTVPNRSVLDCFKQEREKMAVALGEKGIDVRSITVQMS